MPRLPSDAFEQFVAMGAGRSYSKLAAALGVSKRSVTARAAAEHWQERLASLVSEAHARTAKKLVDALSELNDRHLRTLRAVQHKALQGLANAPTGTAAQAASTLIAAVKAERNIVAPPAQEQPAGATPASHAAIAELASSLPAVLVEIASAWHTLDAGERAAVEARLAAARPKVPPPAEPVIPPALLPRVSEN